jgi:hypothetical protein
VRSSEAALLPIARVGGDLDGSDSRGQEGTPIGPGLVAIAVALAQRRPGLSLLRAHLLAVIEVVHAAVEHRLPAWPHEPAWLDPVACLRASIRPAID